MVRSFRSVLSASAAALLLVGTLGACTSTVSGNPSSEKSGPTNSGVRDRPTGTPSPTWPPPLPANALFQITALATASNGATARLTQTVFEPVAQSATDTALLNATCGTNVMGPGGWQAANPDSLFLDVSLVATLQPGSPPFLNADNLLETGLAGWQAYSGSYRHGQAYCSAGYMVIPGTAHEVGFVAASNPALGSAKLPGWAADSEPYAPPISYGFVGGGNYASEDGDHVGGSTVVSDCYIQLSVEAKTVVASQASWAGMQTTGPFKCQSDIPTG